MTKDKIINHLIDKIINSKYQKDPWVHKYINNIFPNELYSDILKHIPTKEHFKTWVDLDKNAKLTNYSPERYMIQFGSTEFKKQVQDQREKLSIQRFKGLGEMNPEELWETTLNPDNRTMLRVQYTEGTKDKSKEDQKIIKVLMGDEVAPRKDFITNNALDVVNLDI